MHLSRRLVLRGMGATLALPVLDAMVPALTAQSKTAAAPVRRLGVFYVPNGMSMPYWFPKSEGPLEAMPPTLKSLAAFKDRVLLCGGLADEPRTGSGAAATMHGAPAPSSPACRSS